MKVHEYIIYVVSHDVLIKLHKKFIRNILMQANVWEGVKLLGEDGKILT